MKKAFSCLLLILLVSLAAAASAATYQTEDELVAYMQTCASRRESAITFTVTRNLMDKLKQNNYYEDVFSRAGLATWSGSSSSDGTYKLTNVQYYDNFRHCRSLRDLAVFISECSSKKLSGFAFYCPDVDIARYDQNLKPLLLQYGISSWSYSYSGHKFSLSQVQYGPNFQCCSNQQELAVYLRRCAANGLSSFSFYLPSASDALLRQSLHNAGIRTWSSSSNGDLHIYSNVVYLRNYKQCSSLAEVKEHVRLCSEKQLTSFAFTYPASAAGLMKNYFDLLFNYGYWQGKAYHVDEDRLIYVEDIVYRPGWNIIRAQANGTLSGLSSSERQALNIAQSVVRDAGRSCSTDFQYAKYFHDYLVTHVTYQKSPEGNVNDTAVGALVYGIAECDGYADSFFLLCSLAGVEAAFQQGDADDPNNDESHLWNSLKLRGQWHFVDITWDDTDCSISSDLFTYRYFNVGYRYMPDHRFYAELSPVSVEPYTDWERFVYTADVGTGIETGVYSDDPGYFISKWYKEGRRVMHLMITGVKSEDALTEYLRSAIKLKGVRWNFYHYDFDDYTLIDLYIRPY